MVKIKKDQLLCCEPMNYISEKKSVVSINHSSQTIDIKWGEQE
jgi:hypothetical protein